MINARGKHVTMVHTNKTGNKCVDVDVVKGGKRTRVFTCLVTIILPKQTKPFYLSSIIGAYKKAHPQFAHATNFKIINNYFQPQMSSGTLTGLKVELLNSAKGTIAGSSLSGTAMIITSPMKLTNLGWIRGAGGRGGYGGQGGTSGPLSKVVKVWAGGSHGFYIVSGHPPKVSLPAGWTMTKFSATRTRAYATVRGPCGTTKVANCPTGHWGGLGKNPYGFGGAVSICGVAVKIRYFETAVGTHFGTISVGAGSITHTVAGHSGGAGGYGGQGIWWNHNATKGHVGAIGGVNKTSGITGYRGGTGGKGADGATWGTAGVRGHQGGTGSHGHVGAYGPATGSHGPTGAGASIKGYRFILHNGSNAGRLSGIHVN